MKSETKIRLQQLFPRLLLLAVLAFMIILLDRLSPFFLTWSNMRNILDQASLYIVLSVGMTFVICSGGIDLSIGSIVAMSGVIMAMCMKAGISIGLAICLGLASGAVIGLINGILISFANINPFIVTLSIMSVIRGTSLLMTNGRPIYGFEEAFKFWGSGNIGPINPPILISLILVTLGILLLTSTRWGNYSLVLGSNEEALRRTGVNVKLYKTSIYVFCGICAAIAGFIVCARLNTAEPLAGWAYEMDAIAAVVLGGADMRGGRGSVFGTFIACLVLAVMQNGLTILSISSNYQQVLTGIIIILAVAVSEFKRRNSKASVN
ncbi:MAG: ABC transporter permease [Clostridia bacterium]|nr:ABC transporter permease [Clostridia bacterium]